MKIVYLTTSTTNVEIKKILDNNLLAFNPSNQNFHHSLIRAFASNFNLEVLSTTRHSENKLVEYEDFIPYHYVTCKNSHLLKKISLQKQIIAELKKIYQQDSDLLLAIDAMNISLGTAGLKFAKKYHLPTIGIISDNPHMLSNVSKIYQKVVENNFKKFTNYIFLTKGLAETFNPKMKPYLIIDGIFMKNEKAANKIHSPYFFFGGALYERYGVKNLVHAFLKTSNDCSLVIAGDGPLKDYLIHKSIRIKRINYVGVLPQSELQYYQNNAIANINPRPFNKDMDKYCIPSKVFEYAASNSVCISTYHSHLYKVFGSSIWWCKDSEEEIKNAIEKVYNLNTSERKKMSNRAHQIINKNYSINAVANKISDFVHKIKN